MEVASRILKLNLSSRHFVISRKHSSHRRLTSAAKVVAIGFHRRHSEAADLEGRTLTDFVIASVQAAAQRYKQVRE
ncbi:type II toxin -antitoxin system TacA 1-like antitoxin [Coleofasciculus sp. C1-SOL-03]|jgi:hypothetical protein|uniref:type II toxin -antitoxin system TacA 1-like antitoxin n=1 Tax=Coleofasciculus sp. C1-SOL-03 TaxID=3069522 RepID=UPI004063457E